MQCSKLVNSIRTHPIHFPPFLLDSKSLTEIVRNEVYTMIPVVPVWQIQPRIIQLLIVNPIIIFHLVNLLLNGQKEVHVLVANKTLMLAVWKVSGNSLLIYGYQIRLPVLSPVLEDQVQTQITTRPGENGLAGVLEKKFIQSSVLYILF